jgi:glycosyltransferase involved in cell wall biosynthesis
VRAPLSVVLIVKNEQDMLPAALESVAFADEIVVADTGSTDGTVEVARRGGARVESIGWEGYVASRNRVLAEARHEWILALDADERVSPALHDEILTALEKDDPGVSGYRMPRLSYLLGRPVRHGTWHPDYKLRLARKSHGFRAEGGRVHEVMTVDGAAKRLVNPLIHYPYRDLSSALRKTSTYARLGAQDRFDRGVRGSVMGLLVRPVVEFLRSLVLRAGFLDGAVGLYVAFLHASSYFLRAAFLLELQRRDVEQKGRRKEITT